jgi:HSP20 family protein
MVDRSPAGEASDAADPSSVKLHADVLAEADRFVIEIDLPGVRSSEVRVHAHGGALVVEGTKVERRPPRAVRLSYERAERDYGPFRRRFQLPGPADLSQARARLKAGVLIITVPRIADRRGLKRRIDVTVET